MPPPTEETAEAQGRQPTNGCGEGAANKILRKMINFEKLLEAGANVSVTVSVADLKEFALYLLDEAKEQGKSEKEPEQWLTPKEAARLLGVSGNTLWRWNNTGYLTHTKVGRKPFYRLSDINKLKNNTKD